MLQGRQLGLKVADELFQLDDAGFVGGGVCHGRRLSVFEAI
jgi:hypothetical protein